MHESEKSKMSAFIPCTGTSMIERQGQFHSFLIRVTENTELVFRVCVCVYVVFLRIRSVLWFSPFYLLDIVTAVDRDCMYSNDGGGGGNSIRSAARVRLATREITKHRSADLISPRNVILPLLVLLMRRTPTHMSFDVHTCI